MDLGKLGVFCFTDARVPETDRCPPPPPILSPLRGSLLLEPWQAEHQAEGTPIGCECRPCGMQIRWTPTDVLPQMQREVCRHYAQYWAQYRNAIRQHVRGVPHVPSR